MKRGVSISWRRWALLALVGLTVLSACQAILGLEDATLQSSDGDAAAASDARTPDASTEAAADAGPSLAVSTGKPVTLFRSGAGGCEVTLVRGAAAPSKVTVVLTDLPSGVTADPLVLDGTSQGSLAVRASANASFGITKVGLRATTDDLSVSATASVDVIVRDLPGTVDTTFPDGGATAAGLEITSVAALPDGAILVAGQLLAGTMHNAVVRLRMDGSVDPAFGISGRAEASQRSYRPELAVDATGHILVAGLLGQNPPLTFYVSRFDSTGKPDPAFAETSPLPALYGGGLIADGGYAFTVAQGATGSSALFLGRIAATGFDPSFGTAGFQSAATFLYSPRLGAIQPDGRFVVVAPGDGTNIDQVVRLMPDGQLDTGFGGDAGLFETSSLGGNPRVALLSDGRIALTGGWDPGVNVENGSLVVMIKPDGMPDTSFATTAARGQVQAIVVEEADRIVVAGMRPTAFGATKHRVFIHRLKSNGTTDSVFNNGSTLIAPRVISSGERVVGAVVDPYRRLIVVTEMSINRYWL